jgi:hypothetical protein
MPDSASFFQKYKKVFLFAFSAIVVVIVLLVSYEYATKYYQAAQYNKYMHEGSAKFISSDFDGAATALETAVKIAPAGLDLYRAQYELGSTYVMQGDDSSKGKAASLFKSLALNASVPPTLRAYSYAQLGFMAANPTNANKFVFNSEPFASMLLEANNIRVSAQAELFTRSDSLYPTPVVEYKLAYLQAIHVSLETASTTNVAVKNEAAATYLLLQHADALQTTQPITKPGEAVTAKISRARTLALLAPYISDITTDVINESYGEALSAVQTAADATSTQGSAKTLQIILEYAAALSAQPNLGASDQTKMKALLAEYLQGVTESPAAASTVKYILENPKDYPNIGKQLANFTSVSPAFGAYLKTL